MKKFFKRSFVAIIAIMLLCSAFVFAACGETEPKFDDYFAIYNPELKSVVSSEPYLAPLDVDHATERVEIKVLKPVKIKHVRCTVLVTEDDAQRFHVTAGVYEIDSYDNSDYYHLTKTYVAGDYVYISTSAQRYSNLLIEFEPVE